MTIKHFEDEHLFAALGEDGRRIGEIEYKAGTDNDYYATHTNVFEGNEGRGVGGQLVDALTNWAAGKGAKIVPICPYVAALFQKKPEKYAAVIK